jgi:hypothetical protein
MRGSLRGFEGVAKVIILMTFTIDPYVSVGPIKFGMKRLKINALLGQKGIAFKRSGSKHKTDHFSELGLLIEYNQGLECVAVEIVRPAVASYRDSNLLSLSFKQVLKLLDDDAAIEKDASGFTSYLYGVGMFFEKKTGPAESVLIFSKGYHNAVNKQIRKLDDVDFTKMSSKEIDKFVKQYMKEL